jgi:WD40 repeat protein
MSDETQNAAPQVEPKEAHLTEALKHNSPLIACRFDPSGKYVFVAGQDSRIVRWDIAEKAKTELAGHESWVRAIAFHPDDGTLVAGDYAGRLLWWPVEGDDLKPQRTVEAHDGWVRAAAVSPDGELLATAGNDNLVKLWRMSDGSPVRELAGHESHVYNVAFHPGGADLVSCDLKGNLIHWNAVTGEEVRRLSAPHLHKYDTTFKADIGGARGLAFSPDGARLAACGITNVSNAFAGVGNPLVAHFDWESGELKQKHVSKANLRGVAWNVAVHPQQFTIALSGGSGGGHVLFWRDDQEHAFHSLKLPNTARDLALSPDGQTLATAHADGHVRLIALTPKG